MFGENKWLMPMMTMSPEDGGGAAGPSGSDGGGGGSSVAPSPSPASTDGGGVGVGADAPAEPAVRTPAPGPDWSQLGSADDLDYIAIPTEQPKPPPPPQQDPAKPVIPPAQPLQPLPVQDPPAPPPAAATDGQPPTEAAKPLTASDPWRIAEGLEAHRDAVIPHLAATKFALSEEDLRELDADPGAAIPKMLAKAFFESQVSMQKFLAQAVPGMIKNYNTVVTANEGAEKKFFDTHKDLDASNPQHREVAARIATVYRKANPGIPLDQLIQEVGPMVMMSLKVNAGTAPQVAPGVNPAALPRGGTSFRPAVNGGGGAPIATEPPNPWSGLGTNYD